MTIRSISDLSKTNRPPNDHIESFAGGEKSGIAIEQPDGQGWPMAQGPPPPNARVVSLYRDGFTVDGGPFRSLSEPHNAEFLAQLKKGEAPEELRSSAGPQGQVQVLLKDMGEQTYQSPTRAPAPSPSPNYNLFGGSGQSLSGNTGGASPAAAPVTLPVAGQAAVALNEAEPTTQLAFRLHEGTRLTQTFNTTATVQDLYAFVDSVAPVASGYDLISGFPPRPITANRALTLQAAGLLNESLTQKVK